MKTACPLSGEYSGVLPNDSGFCVTLSTDCKSSLNTVYTVSKCSDPAYTLDGNSPFVMKYFINFAIFLTQNEWPLCQWSAF